MANPYFGLIDDNSPSPKFALSGSGFEDTTSMGQYPENFKHGQHIAPANDGTSKATYTFTGLPNSSFDIWATWYPFNFEFSSIDAANDVPFKVYDDTTLLQTFSVNQSEYPIDDGNNPYMRFDDDGNQLPPWDFQANGAQWRKIGTVSVSSGTLKVEITDGASSSYCWADAIRVTEVVTAGNCTIPLKYTDSFPGTTLSDSWTTTNGTWTASSGVLSITSPNPSSGNKAVLWPYEDWDYTDNFEMLAKVRVDTWTNNNDNSQAGLSFPSSISGAGHNLCFRGGTTNKLALLHDFVGVFTITFVWTIGSWYWFRFKRVGDDLYGRVWLDGSTEPSSWTITQTIGGGSINQLTTGYPTLNGGIGVSTASFSDLQVGPIETSFACASLTSTNSTVSSSGVFLSSVHGSASKSASHPTISSGGTVTPPGRAGTMTKSSTHPTISSGALRGAPNYGATCSKTVGHPTISSAGIRKAPAYGGVLGTPKSALAYWRMDEGSGLQALDSSGNGHTATLSGTASWTSGRLGPNAIQNSTIGSPATISPVVTVTRPFSVAVWFKVTSFSTDQRLIFDSTSSRGLVVATNALVYWADSSNYLSTSFVSINVWQHLVMTLSNVGDLKLYINGVAAGSYTSVNPGTVNFNQFCGNAGSIDELQIYNTVLSATEIANLAAGMDAATPIPVGYSTISSTGVKTGFSATGNCGITATHPNITSAAAWSISIRHGIASLSSHPTITSMGGEAAPNYTGTLSKICAHSTISGTLSYSGPVSSSMPLFLWGTEYPSWIGSMPLLALGGLTTTGSTDLVTRGHDTSSGNIPLFLFCRTEISKGLNLFLKANPVGVTSSSLKLYLTGSHVGYDGLVKSMPLVTAGWDNPPYKPMNLYVKGIDQGALSGVINLNIRGSYASVGSSLPLLVCNNNSRQSSDLLLYIRGDGVTPGAIPFNSSLNLYVQRGPNNGITLFLQNNGAAASLPLLIAGHPNFSGEIPLFIEGMGGDVSGELTLSIPSVSAPLSLNSQIPLSIRNVIGRDGKSVPLNITGWKS